jgi:ABC-2 type transport system permease protein
MRPKLDTRPAARTKSVAHASLQPQCQRPYATPASWARSAIWTRLPTSSSAIEVVSLIVPVLGILLVTSEWSQRAGLATFALVPQRERVIVAKAIGATVLTVFAVAACVGAIGNVFTGGDWSLGLGQLGRLGLYELIGMLGGVASGLAFMSSALAIVMYFVIPIGWSILGETIAALDKPADWLDLSRPMGTLADSTAAMSGTDWAQLGTAAAVWVGVVFVIGLVRLRRTELK